MTIPWRGVVLVLALAAAGCTAEDEPDFEIRLASLEAAAGHVEMKRTGRDAVVYVAAEPLFAAEDVADVQPVLQGKTKQIEVLFHPEAEDRLRALYASRPAARVAVLIGGEVALVSPLSPECAEGYLVLRERLSARRLFAIAQAMGHGCGPDCRHGAVGE